MPNPSCTTMDVVAAWRLEHIRLDALAGGGKGADVKKELERLAVA
jgi:hypothetical protein